MKLPPRDAEKRLMEKFRKWLDLTGFGCQLICLHLMKAEVQTK
jgi:hypothetical protein